MAVGYAPTPASDKRYKHRITGYLVASCLTAATAGLLFGYDVGISGGVSSMDDFQKKFYPSVYRDSRDAKLWPEDNDHLWRR